MCYGTVSTTSTVIDGNKFIWDVLTALQAGRPAMKGKEMGSGALETLVLLEAGRQASTNNYS